MSYTVKNSYADLLTGIKSRVQMARVRAGLAANRELILLYWDIGRLVAERQSAEGWSASVIDRLSIDIRHDFPDLKGFSARNIWRMKSFYLAYREQIIKLPQAVAEIGSIDKSEVRPPLVAKLDNESDLPPVFQIPWAHNVLLIEKVKDPEKRLWYMRQAIEHGWSRNVLALHIDQQDYERKGLAVTNFSATLPSPLSDLAQDLLKDPYIFDFQRAEKIPSAGGVAAGRGGLHFQCLKQRADRKGFSHGENEENGGKINPMGTYKARPADFSFVFLLSSM